MKQRLDPFFRPCTIAVDVEMLDAICVAPGYAAEDDDIRVLVINGEQAAKHEGPGEVR